MAFLLAENENQKVEDLPQADFGRVPERFLLKDLFSCTNRHLTRSLRSLARTSSILVNSAGIFQYLNL